MIFEMEEPSPRVVFIVSVAIVCVALIIATAFLQYTRAFIAGGYCETTVPGHSGIAWVKCP